VADPRLEPALRWFADQGRTPFGFQRRAWTAYLEGRSGLIHSPTGSGKTLAAWLGPLLDAATGQTPGLKVLWITPLRALARDTTEGLAAAVAGMGVGWRVEMRTGDTGQTARSRQRARPPDALVTTPESLSVMLSHPDAGTLLSGVRGIVVDEWHELLGSKRGVQLQLCLARLRRLAPGLRTWGLSATLGNLREAMEVLLGPGHEGELVRGEVPRDIRIRALVPPEVERFPWAGHLGTRLLPRVVEAIDGAGTTLFFTNTRSQAELWHEALVAARPDWRDRVALHHGSVDRTRREAVERGIAEGTLKCVVCTSSLDLGVDFSPVDQVIQVGSPKGVARLMQRAGRSGHRPGVPSEVLCVPTHAFELVEIAAARRAWEAGRIEARTPPVLCLDVSGDPRRRRRLRRGGSAGRGARDPRLRRPGRGRLGLGDGLHHPGRAGARRLSPVPQARPGRGPVGRPRPHDRPPAPDGHWHHRERRGDERVLVVPARRAAGDGGGELRRTPQAR